MSNIRKTLFISDLHLTTNQPELTERFLYFISNINNDVDSLYILGDLFEAVVGDDDPSTFMSLICEALQRIRNQGIPTFFIHGNRDFLLHNHFRHLSKCHILNEHQIIDLYGEKVLIMHGDTLCTLDKRYMRMRKVLRNRFLQRWLFLKLPLKFRLAFAKHLRKTSKEYTKRLHTDMMDVCPKTVSKVMRENKVKFLIHGHTHRKATHQFCLENGEFGHRFVLGSWEDQPNVLVWNEKGQQSFEYF